ncbi:hypothetical protein GGS20DRAFT_234842 [Poronia punctata]|nr:hypothetical protein GGS20DRAFT_234842 [Poronia punctata]
MTTFGTGNASDTASMQDIDTLIWSMTMLRVNLDPENPRTIWPHIPVIADECSVFYCVKKHEPVVQNGVFTEKASQVIEAQRSPQSWQPLTALNASNNGTNTGSQRPPPDRLASLEFHNDTSRVSRSDLMLVSEATGSRLTFNVSHAAVDSISYFFQNTLATKLKTVSLSSDKLSSLTNGWYITDDHSHRYEPSLSQVLYSSRDLAVTFSSLAASMSNALRRGADEKVDSGPDSEPVNKVVTGHKGVVTFFYRVEWPWIVVHGMSAVIGTFFIAATIKKNHGTQPWGSSSLATMSRGPLVQHMLAGTQTVKKMEAEARNERVVLLSKETNTSLEDLGLDPLQQPGD